MTVEELMEKVKTEVGFTIFPLTIPAFGMQVYAGQSVICDLDGNILRTATEADIQRWDTVWKRAVKSAVS
jgi:hypothetical protein